MDINVVYDNFKNKLLEFIRHDYDISPNTVDTRYVYHCAKPSSSENDGYKAIFKFGFERYFVNRGAGNMYGPGVYTTIDLASSSVNARKNIYGNVIIKAEIQSYDKFLIWHEILAKKVYGDKWRMKDQFEMLIPEAAAILKRERPEVYKHLTELGPGRNAEKARDFWVLCSNGILKNTNAYDKIHGLAFIGQNDGHVAVVKDVKNLIPIEYSLDYGHTWKRGATEKTIRYTKDDFDVQYHYGKRYDKTTPPEFGYAKVEKRGKFNFVDKNGKEISTTWFDAASNFVNTVEGYPVAEIIYAGYSLYLTKEGYIYQSIDDDYPLCHADELPNEV